MSRASFWLSSLLLWAHRASLSLRTSRISFTSNAQQSWRGSLSCDFLVDPPFGPLGSAQRRCPPSLFSCSDSSRRDGHPSDDDASAGAGAASTLMRVPSSHLSSLWLSWSRRHRRPHNSPSLLPRFLFHPSQRSPRALLGAFPSSAAVMSFPRHQHDGRLLKSSHCSGVDAVLRAVGLDAVSSAARFYAGSFQRGNAHPLRAGY
jgi:hypothetical protein